MVLGAAKQISHRYTFIKVGRAHNGLYFAQLHIFSDSVAYTREGDGDTTVF
jgi:hypothetical protein